MKKHIISLAFFAIALVGCSPYQKALKSKDNDYKVAVADHLFEEERYAKAINLYEAIEKEEGWKPERQRMFVNYAKAQYVKKKYESLTGILRKFNTLYPQSPFREDMMYMEAMTLYKRSEPYSRDQKVTYDAIVKLNDYQAAFPESEHKDEVQKYQKELQKKLEQKAYENAKLYNQIGGFTRDYNAAIVALDNFILDFPGSEYKEDALYYKFDSAYELAINSVYVKMEERLQSAIRYYNSLIAFNEETHYKEKADRMLARLQNELKQFSKN